MDTVALWEAELRHRGLAVHLDPGSGCYRLRARGRDLTVSLDNLSRQVELSPDPADTVRRFLDAVLQEGPRLGAAGLYWYLEPNDHAHPAPFRVAVSPRVDRVLAHVATDGSLISWVTESHLAELGLSADEADALAWTQLAAVADAVTVHTHDLDGVTLGLLETDFTSKASLLLSPALRHRVADTIGWPIHAVAPDRDFVYLWTAQRPDVAGRMGAVVVREFASAPYPLSTEVFEIGDTIRAIGAFSSP